MDAPQFTENEKVLAYHQGMIYEAKVLKMEHSADRPLKSIDSTPSQSTGGPARWWHLLHYQGWNDRWDEWVDDTRLMKINDENRERQARMADEQRKGKSGKDKSKKKALKDASPGQPNKKKKRPDGTSVSSPTPTGISPVPSPLPTVPVAPPYSQGGLPSPLPSSSSSSAPTSSSSSSSSSSTTATSSYPSSSNTSGSIFIELQLPLPLKRKLVDDWEQVIHERSLVPLPRSPSVAEIIRAYQKYRGDPSPLPFDPVLSGFVAYFDKALGSILLYRFERQQYAWVLRQYPFTPMSQVYGAEHLLRFFTKLPGLIPAHEMELQTRARIEHTLGDLIRYLNRNVGSLFAEDYEAAPPTYLRSSIVG